MNDVLDNPLTACLARTGFVAVPAEQMHALLRAGGVTARDWQAFAESWQRMPVDRYMADGGRYRRRRHAVCHVAPDGQVERLPQRPHYQSRDYNPINGGIQRWFAPIEDDSLGNATLAALMRLAAPMFSALAGDVRRWYVEIHQFRIEAAGTHPGQPTPEGVHRDGVDYVLVMLLGRHNVQRGRTDISQDDGTPLGHFTLTEAGDAILLDDHRVLHGVTPIQAIDPTMPAHRDALVITFARNAPAAEREDSADEG
ncbi:2OG-Fe dioxygenase family protein [Algiphilus sp.]|uniref:2OG-Fe dioxygenase family protein n=1 Tax=Algiphilus sp. TaxID=1872431 RepID=UPI003B520CF4